MSNAVMEKNLSQVPTSVKDRFIKLIDPSLALDSKLKEIRREVITKPVVYIGAGTCGLAAGAGATRKEIEQYLSEKTIDVQLIEVGCIGLCTSEPLVDIQLPGKNRLSFQNITEDKVKHLLDNIFNGQVPTEILLGQFDGPKEFCWENLPYINQHPFFATQTRYILENCGVNDPVSIEEYIANGGYSALLKTIHSSVPSEVCDLVESSGLRGRGGGGFLTGRKWKFALNTDADQKYLVCNADEGDPGAFMDRAVIEGDPHKMIEGMAIAAYAIGATKSYVYIRAEYPLAIRNLVAAIEQAKRSGLLGENIFDSGYNLEINIKVGAGAFVCGEETALLHSIEGKRGMPRPRPPFPAAKGLFGKPTIINNVETMANISKIISLGADWFSAMGTGSSKGTKVFALSGKVKRCGLVEIPMGMSIRDIIYTIGGGIENDNKFKAVQFGGPSGGCIPESHLDLNVDYESLKSVGAMIGSGGMVVMDETNCMVDVAKYFMNFIQMESCGKCIPCREGTRSMLEIIESICKGRGSEDGNDALIRFKGIMQLENLAEVIRDSSLCGLGQSAPNPILSTLRWFRDEYEEHIFERKCSAGVCQELLTYVIDTDKCIGCTACKRKCPTGAIVGEVKKAHYIIEDKCVGCGACYDVCKPKAVFVS